MLIVLADFPLVKKSSREWSVPFGDWLNAWRLLRSAVRLSSSESLSLSCWTTVSTLRSWTEARDSNWFSTWCVIEWRAIRYDTTLTPIRGTSAISRSAIVSLVLIFMVGERIIPLTISQLHLVQD